MTNGHDPMGTDITTQLRALAHAEDNEVFAGGRMMPERQLGEKLGVGRAALRRALDLLEAEGLIVRRQGHGTFLRTMMPASPETPALAQLTSPVEILEVRYEVEPILARLAAMRATPLRIASMGRYAGKAANAREPREYEKWDSALHAEIAAGADNSLFYALFETVAQVRKEHGWSSLRDRTFTGELRDFLSHQHAQIVDAIQLREPELAEQRMRDHLRKVSDMLHPQSGPRP